MADVSLSTLPIATPTAVATPGTTPVEGTAEGTTPFASLLTTLADPATPTAKTPAPLLPGAAALVALTDPGLALSSATIAAAQPDADGEAIPTLGKSDPTVALAPDLSAFLASIAPSRIASITVRATTPQGDSASDGTNTTAAPGAAATTIPTQAVPVTSPPTPDATAPSDATAPLVPDRVAQAVAAIRALAVRASAPATTSPAAPAVIVSRRSDAPANDAATTQPSFARPAVQPTAPAPVTAAITTTQSAGSAQTDGTALLASLPIDAADPAASTGEVPLTIGAVAPTAVLPTPIAPTDPGRAVASADPAPAHAEVDDDVVPDTGKRDQTVALAPDLSAFLAAMAPPPQIAPVVVRVATPQGGTSEDGAKAAASPDAMATTATVTRQTTPIALPAMQDAPAPARNAPAEPATTSEPATIAPDRMAQAFAAVRAMATRTPDPAVAPPAAPIAPAIVGAPSAAPVATTAPATDSVATRPSVTPANAAPAPQSSTPAAQAAAPPVVVPSVATTQAAAQAQDAAPLQDTAPAPRAPVSVSPASVTDSRRADPAPAAAVASTVTSSDTQRPAPARARKAADTAQIGDVRTDVAPAQIDLASLGQTAPAPLADDPVARQLSIAQDGQWLDSLAKDIAGAGNANGQLNFRLDPDHLGSLTVQLTQTADGASVRLTASTEAARTILADAQPRLMAEARAQGLTLREATVETRTAAPTPTASANAGFSGSGNQSGRSDQGVAAQLQQQSQQQGGNRRHAPDQPRQAANPAPRAPASTRSGADLYA